MKFEVLENSCNPNLFGVWQNIYRAIYGAISLSTKYEASVQDSIKKFSICSLQGFKVMLVNRAFKKQTIYNGINHYAYMHSVLPIRPYTVV